MKTPISFIVIVVAALLLSFAAMPARADILYGSSTSTLTIDKLTSSGVGSVFASPVGRPEGVAFDLAGNLYVADSFNNKILKITPGGVTSIFVSTGLNGPKGLAFDSAGNLFVTNYYDVTIKKFNTAGVGTLFASGLAVPRGLAFDATGNLFVADGFVIRKYTPGGVASIFANTGGQAPDGMAFDTSGNLYVAYSAAAIIQKFTPSGIGTVFSSFTNTHYTSPEGIAFDSVGNLYVATGSGVVAKINPAGVDSAFTSTYFRQSEGLAFTNDSGVPLPLANQVPEPASAALLGFGALFLAGRRRQELADRDCAGA